MLRSIRGVIEAGRAAGIPVGMCGEATADPALIPLLLAWGLDEFSVSPSAVLATRRIISLWSTADAAFAAGEAMKLSATESIVGCLESLKRSERLRRGAAGRVCIQGAEGPGQFARGPACLRLYRLGKGGAADIEKMQESARKTQGFFQALLSRTGLYSKAKGGIFNGCFEPHREGAAVRSGAGGPKAADLRAAGALVHGPACSVRSRAGRDCPEHRRVFSQAGAPPLSTAPQPERMRPRPGPARAPGTRIPRLPLCCWPKASRR